MNLALAVMFLEMCGRSCTGNAFLNRNTEAEGLNLACMVVQLGIVTTMRSYGTESTYHVLAYGRKLWIICGYFLWRRTSPGNVRSYSCNGSGATEQWRPLSPQYLGTRKIPITGFLLMAPVAQTNHYSNEATADRRLGAGAPVFISPLAWLSNCYSNECESIDAHTARYNGESDDAPTTTTDASHSDNVVHVCKRRGDNFYSFFTGRSGSNGKSNKFERNPVPVMANSKSKAQLQTRWELGKHEIAFIYGFLFGVMLCLCWWAKISQISVPEIGMR